MCVLDKRDIKNVQCWGFSRTWNGNHCHRRTIFGSTKNHSVKGYLKNHLFLTFLYSEEPSFATNNLLWNKGSADIKGSSWNHSDKKGYSMASWSTFIFKSV